MTEPFTPYWLIHEPGKQAGFAIVAGDQADCSEDAIATWRTSEEVEKWLKHGIDYANVSVEATLITEPFTG